MYPVEDSTILELQKCFGIQNLILSSQLLRETDDAEGILTMAIYFSFY